MSKIQSKKQSRKLGRGISIPTFHARGMAVQRKNGEMVSPYYLAYEDLCDDWAALWEKKAVPSETPQVEVVDLPEVLCLSKGLLSDETYKRLERIKEAENNRAANGNGGESLSVNEVEQVLRTPGVIPPRREIDLIRRYYRNKAGRKGEFQAARIVFPK